MKFDQARSEVVEAINSRDFDRVNAAIDELSSARGTVIDAISEVMHDARGMQVLFVLTRRERIVASTPSASVPAAPHGVAGRHRRRNNNRSPIERRRKPPTAEKAVRGFIARAKIEWVRSSSIAESRSAGFRSMGFRPCLRIGGVALEVLHPRDQRPRNVIVRAHIVAGRPVADLERVTGAVC